MGLSSKRAEYVALTSLILSFLFFIVNFLLGRWSGFFAVTSSSWLYLATAIISLVLWIQFHQRSLAEQEKLDTKQLNIEDKSTIFETNERQMMLAVAGKRLELLEKWFLPIFSIFLAIYEIGIGFYLLRAIDSVDDLQKQQPLVVAICMVAVAFMSFLLSRYSTGMSGEQVWRPLRASGSYLLAGSIICFGLAIGLAIYQFKNDIVVQILNWAIPIMLMLMGLEAIVNLIFDIYRPRIAGQYNRSAFDSRLLGTINEPGGVFRSAATALDYQFGFQVSHTWFYKLLEKAIVPLVILMAVTLYAMSCVVIVEPGEQAIIEHFGNPKNAEGEVRLVEPGCSFKWPWPIDKVRKLSVNRLKQLHIGYKPKVDDKEEPRLWGESHYEEEYNLLVASGTSGVRVDSRAAPVSLVITAVPVQYKIKDLYAYLYNYSDPDKLLEGICYKELTRFGASARLEADIQNVDYESLLGAGRVKAKGILTDRIQKAANEKNLGIEVVFVGLQGVHPPVEVADAFHKVVGAVQKKQAEILSAQAFRNQMLSYLAGSVEEAEGLYKLAADYLTAKDSGDEAKIEQLRQDLDKAFSDVSGEIFTTLSEAKSYAYEKATLAKATGERFADQLKAYEASNQIFKQEQRLTVLEEALKDIRKYVVVGDDKESQVFILDVQEKLTPGLYDITGFEDKAK